MRSVTDKEEYAALAVLACVYAVTFAAASFFFPEQTKSLLEAAAEMWRTWPP